MELVILVIGLVFNLFICSLVLIKNPKQLTNRTIAATAIALVAWEGPNYLADKATTHTLFWNRATFLAPMFIFIFSSLFIAALKGDKFPKKTLALLLSVTALFSALAFTGTVAVSVYPRYSGSVQTGYNIRHGSLYLLIIAWTLILIAQFVLTLLIAWRKARGQLKKQLNIVVYGSVCATALAIVTNLVLPNLTNSSSSAQFAPIASVIFMGSLAFAIFRHGLFDIKLIVARSLAYVLSLLSLASVFVLGTFAITNLFFDSSSLKTSTTRWIYTLTAVILAFLFTPLRQFFDRITNRFFYRDAYDTQTFLNLFNKGLVSTYKLDQLLAKCAQITEENLKPSYCLFSIPGPKSLPDRLVGSSEETHLKDEPALVLKSLKEYMAGRNLLITDLLDEEEHAMHHFLGRNDISIVAQLTSSSSDKQAETGYLILGPKRSGNLYSSQDLKVIEIIANELVIAVQNALRFEEIENFNITLQQRVDDATRKMRRANEKLKTLDETKDDFISMASHQLRTPLTSVKGYISLILEGDAGKITPVQHKMLQQAFFSSQQMVYLIADLLNVSRLRTGKFIIQPTPVHLARVISEELSQLKETAKLHSINLEYKPPKDFPELMLDETKTRQVIMNFIDNAIYYTPQGGTIDVELEDKGHSIELRVIDSGIGVPKSEQPHLFTKFYRAANARKARPDGTGLGLYMARKVIVAQGGSIIFDSKEGNGSTFGFTFKKTKTTKTT